MGRSGTLATTAAALLLGGLFTIPCRADDSDQPWYEQVKLDGLLSASYSYNFNRPDSATNQFRVFDFEDNSFRLDVAELVVQKEASQPRAVGFRLDVAAGSSVPRVVAAADPGNRGDDPKDFDVQQAFVGWVAPVGKGLRLELGHFVTHLGYELIEGYDGYNDNATRSFLFGYAIPFTHTGLRVSYPFCPKASAMLMVVNGWDNARDNNRTKSVGAQVILTPAESLTVTVNGMIGPEGDDDERDQRRILDVSATWKVTKRVALGVNLDHGTEEAAPLPENLRKDATWSGGAAYARLALTDRFSIALRAEQLDDRDGWRTGVAQRLREITLTPEYHVGEHLVLRGDLRLDSSDEKVFEKVRGRATDRQATALFNALYVF